MPEEGKLIDPAGSQPLRTRKGRESFDDAMQMTATMGVDADDFKDPIKARRINDTLKFFRQYEDGLQIMRQVALSKPRKDRLDILFEYATLRGEMEQEAREIANEEKELEARKKKAMHLKRSLGSLE